MTSTLTIAGKEVRALLPTWLAAAVILGLAGVLDDPRIAMLALLGYGLGAITLGSLSMGHEYSGRTLALLLSQPMARSRVLPIKSGVLAAMLLTLAVMARALLASTGIDAPDLARAMTSPALPLLVLPLLGGLFLAPLLTMWCRSAMAGVVFSVTAISLTWGVAAVWAILHFGSAEVGRSDLQGFRLAIFWRAMVALSAAAAVSGWWMFMHLQAIDGPGQELHLPRWARRPPPDTVSSVVVPAGRARPLWELTKKELRLQQMTFTVAALYALWWAGMTGLRQLAPQTATIPVAAVTLLFGMAIALLAGALASAEERQLGTLEWQVLLPISSSWQWAIKAGTALVLALLLGLGMPALLEWVAPSPDRANMTFGKFAPAILLLATTGLYVSSFSTGGVRALLLSLPITLGLFVFARLVVGPALFALGRLQAVAGVVPDGFFVTTRSLRWLLWLTPALAVSIAAVIAALALRFALVNHRSSGRHLGRLWRQACWMAGTLLLGVVLMEVVQEVTIVALRANQPARRTIQPAPGATSVNQPGSVRQ